MSRLVNVKQDTLDDVDRAELWYDRRRSGLGKRFRNRVEHALKRIGQNPYINAAGIYGVRRMMTEKFK